MAIVGALVSLDCGKKGYFQGTVLAVDDRESSVTLQKPFLDGRPLGVEKTIVAGSDINAIRVLKVPVPPQNPAVGQQIASPSSSTTATTKVFQSQQYAKNAPPSSRPRSIPHNHNHFHPISTSSDSRAPTRYFPPPPTSDTRRSTPTATNKSAANSKRSDGPCGIPQLDKAPGGGRTVAEGNRELNTPLDYDLMRTDFDFEANLALFDKQRDIDPTAYARSGEATRVSRNYAHNENIVSDPSRLFSWTAALAASSSPTEAGERGGGESAATAQTTDAGPFFVPAKLVACCNDPGNVMPMLDGETKRGYLDEAQRQMGGEVFNCAIADRLLVFMLELMQRYDIMVKTVAVLGSANTNRRLFARILRHLFNRACDTVVFCDANVEIGAKTMAPRVRLLARSSELPRDVQMVIALDSLASSSRELESWFLGLDTKCHIIAIEHRIRPHISPGHCHTMMIGTGTVMDDNLARHANGATRSDNAARRNKNNIAGETVVADVGIPFAWIADDDEHLAQAFSMQVLVRISP